MKKIKMILAPQDRLKKLFKKDDLDQINKNLKVNLPAMFGKNLINFNTNDFLCFSTYDALSNKNNIEALINSDPNNWDTHGHVNDCQNIKINNSETNIFLIPGDMDGFPPYVYKIEENKKQDKYFFNTHLLRGNIFQGPKIVSKSLNVKKKIKTHQFEIKNNKLVLFGLPNSESEKKYLLENKEKFLSILLEKKKACKIDVKNGKYKIYSFYDYQFGEEDVSGFGCYGHLLMLE